MKSESLNNPNENSYSQTLKFEKDNVTCKDGFCSLHNRKKESEINKDDMNLFDPI